MIRRVTVIGILTILTIAGVSGFPPASAAGGVTKGELAVQMVRASGVTLPVQGAEEAAAQVLRAGGIDLGRDLKAGATEAMLAQIGRALGSAVSTSRPAAPVSPAVGKAFVQAISGSLQAAIVVAADAGTQVTHASCKGLASRQDRKGTPASPANINATADPCEEPIP